MVEAIERDEYARTPHLRARMKRSWRYTISGLSDDVNLDQAKADFANAQAAYAAGDFSKAGQLYESSYMNAPRPELLFDAAQAWRQAGDTGRAVIFYKQYIDQAPTGTGANDARSWIAKLQGQPMQSSAKSIWWIVALVGMAGAAVYIGRPQRR